MEILAVFAPLAAFLMTGLFGKQFSEKGVCFITCASAILAAFASIILFFQININAEITDTSYTHVLGNWIHCGAFSVSWAVRVDSLSVLMMCAVNIISACVHVYSVGYMEGDFGKSRFMAYLSFLTFAMLILVSANNALQLFFGWEGVGLASYLLIGFWNRKHSANAAAMKAFIVNRVGDFGLILGIIALYVTFGTLDFEPVFKNAAAHAETFSLTLICLLFLMGAVGKSAQLGLHTWLPDEMAAPTPVSALIHSATMVTAGVFLIARFSPLFEYSPVALTVITILGGTTAFVAATIALVQFDIKRVIAYSTMSQLGYMMFALGVSAYSAAMFHLLIHAFFKALLFLGAGNVIHALGGEQDMRNMGGLRDKMPITYGLMIIGVLALVGIFPFSGYYSENIIFKAAWASENGVGHYAYFLGILTAFMTAFYSFRLIYMVFHGGGNNVAHKEIHEKAQEAPVLMTAPLMVLAVGSVFFGAFLYGAFTASPEIAGNELVNTWSRPFFWHDALFVLLGNDTIKAAHNVSFWVKALPLVMALLGIGMGVLFYRLRPDFLIFFTQKTRVLHTLLRRKWYFDDAYQAFFVRGVLSIGRKFSSAEKSIIDTLGSDGLAGISKRFAKGLSAFQSGTVYRYAFVMIIFLICLLSWFVYKADPSFYRPDTPTITITQEAL